MSAEAKPYRPNVGIALFNADGRVLIARRTGDDGPEIIEPGLEWQMPQGGIEAGEDILAAARRELAEETGIVQARPIAVAPEALCYDWPAYHGPPHRLAAWRGQRQHWVAMRFEGSEAGIDLMRAPPGETPEFDRWRWERLDRLPSLVVSYKRAVYREVVRLFAAFAGGP